MEVNNRRSFLKRFLFGASSIAIGQAVFADKAMAALKGSNLIPYKAPAPEVIEPLGDFIEHLMQSILNLSGGIQVPLMLVRTKPDAKHNLEVDLRFSKRFDADIGNHIFSGRVVFFIDSPEFTVKKAVDTKRFVHTLGLIINDTIKSWMDLDEQERAALSPDVDISWAMDSKRVSEFLAKSRKVRARTRISYRYEDEDD